LRNFFYSAMICSAAEFDRASDPSLTTAGYDADDDDGAGGDVWLSYFSEARSKCQEVLEKVESFHAVFSLKGLTKSPATVLGDSLAVKLRLDRIRRGDDEPTSRAITHAAAAGLRTPPRHQFRQSASPTSDVPASPSEYLTRTPTRAVDRTLFLAARPPFAALYRDPDTEHMGLLNIRQCCFVNAFLQFAFAVPALVSAVFAFPTAESLRAFRAASKLTPKPSALTTMPFLSHNQHVHQTDGQPVAMLVAHPITQPIGQATDQGFGQQPTGQGIGQTMNQGVGTQPMGGQNQGQYQGQPGYQTAQGQRRRRHGGGCCGSQKIRNDQYATDQNYASTRGSSRHRHGRRVVYE
jgi:hypothetical protein